MNYPTLNQTKTFLTPFLRCSNNDIGTGNHPHIGRRVTSQFDHLLAKVLLQPHLPVNDTLTDQRLEWRYVHALLPNRHVEYAEHAELGRDSFATAGWRAQQAVIVRVVEAVEYLCLNGIEVREAIQRLVLLIGKSRDWQRIQV